MPRTAEDVRKVLDLETPLPDCTTAPLLPGMIACFRSGFRAFVCEPAQDVAVYPCVMLSRSAGPVHAKSKHSPTPRCWIAEPFLIRQREISGLAGFSLDERWLRLLLDMVTEELAPLLPGVEETFPDHDLPEDDLYSGDTIPVEPDTRLARHRVEDFLSDGYRAFFTSPVKQRRWFIASRWPDWRARGYTLDEIAAEVAAEEQINSYPSDSLRKQLKQMGLR